MQVINNKISGLILFKFVLFCFCVGLFSCNAQEKRTLKKEDYKLWTTLGSSGISVDGKWVSYTINHNDTLVLHTQNTISGFEYVLPGGHSEQFSDTSKWLGYLVKDSLRVVDLASQRTHFVAKGVTGFSFIKGGTHIIATSTIDGSSALVQVDLKSFETTYKKFFVASKFTSDFRRVALITKENNLFGVVVLDLKSDVKATTIISGVNLPIEGLQWDDRGTKLAFFEELKNSTCGILNHTIYTCALGKDSVSIKQLNPELHEGFPKGYYVPVSTIYLSDSIDYVFFDIRKIPEFPVGLIENKVRIWKSEDVCLDQDDNFAQLKSTQFWTLWKLDSDTVLRVEDEHYCNVVLTGDDQNALLYDPFELAPMHKFGGDYIAVYIKNLCTGSLDLVAPKQVFFGNETLVSPGGKYVSYFTEDHWWVYDIALKTSRCLTKGMPISFSHVDAHKLLTRTPDGCPGWTPVDRSIILYDNYDIWLFSPDGTWKKRLTDGSKTNTIYRISDSSATTLVRDSFFGFTCKAYSFDSDVLLTTQNSSTYAEGFSVLNKHKKLVPLVERKSKMSLVENQDSRTLLFMESNFELPPRLLLYRGGKEREIVQSNQQQQQFYWGSSEVIHYTDTKGVALKGALFYPANYNSAKKYPMVVFIYEMKSNEVYNYVAPSISDSVGFTISNYTSDGYFVLLPDITYTLNETGASAVGCVTSAVYESLKNPAVDSGNLALMGHSFGGYETAYIMGHSSLFKTAVVGAAMIDLPSAYLTTDGHGFSNMWRFEFGQFRIDAPFDSMIFDQNSPLKSVKNISAPLLIWTGTADPQLDWRHSEKLHSALWRYGKKSTLLIYPNEGHALLDVENKIDLSTKIKDYLDYYLKGSPLQEWMGKQ